MQILRRSPWALGGAGLIVTLIAFLCGFALFFPAESLRPRLEAEGARVGMRLSITALETTFPPGLAARAVTVGDRAKEGGAVKIERLALAPAWSRLLIGQPAVRYDASLLGGRIAGMLSRRGPLTLQGENLSWRGPLPGLSGGILSLTGCSGEVSAFWPAQADDPQSLAVTCEEGRVEGLFGAREPVLLGSIALNASGRGKELRVTTLSASGGHLGLDGNGTILLNTPLGRSLLNLNLNLRGHGGLDPTLAELLAAFVPPATDGTSQLRLSGTLAAPQQSRVNR